MQGADMQEVWFIKIFALFGKIVAGVLGAITPIARIISGLGSPSQALTLDFNGFVGTALTAGSEFLFLESNVTVKRNS